MMYDFPSAWEKSMNSWTEIISSILYVKFQKDFGLNIYAILM